MQLVPMTEAGARNSIDGLAADFYGNGRWHEKFSTRKKKLLYRLLQKQNEWALTHGHLTAQKLAILHELAEHPRHHGIVKKVLSCRSKRPCNSKWCPVCSDPKYRGKKARHANDCQPDRAVCNVYGTEQGTQSSNYAVKAGHRMASAFEGLSLSNLHYLTINLGLIPISGNLKVSRQEFDKRVRKILKQMQPAMIARGKYDLALKWSDELAWTMPTEEMPDELRGEALPHVRYAMLHIHLVVFHPTQTAESIRSGFSAEFPGANRICLRPVQEDVMMSNGQVRNGVQGALEYSSLEKVELPFGADSGQAAIEFADIDATWCRANRNFRFGKMASEQRSVIERLSLGTLEWLYRTNKRLTTKVYGVPFLYTSVRQSSTRDLDSAEGNCDSIHQEITMMFSYLYALASSMVSNDSYGINPKGLYSNWWRWIHSKTTSILTSFSSFFSKFVGERSPRAPP